MPEPIPEMFPDESIVVRGGGMNEPYVLLAAQKHAKRHDGIYAISVRCRHDYDEAELYRQLGYLPYMVSTVGRIRAHGYDVVSSEREFGDAHADLVFGLGEPSEPEITELKNDFVRRNEEQK